MVAFSNEWTIGGTFKVLATFFPVKSKVHGAQTTHTRTAKHLAEGHERYDYIPQREA